MVAYPDDYRLDLFTNAPQAYDGFGTEEIESAVQYAFVRDNGQPLRHVRVLARHYGWQTGRYRSGLYIVLTPAEAEHWKDDRLLIPKDSQ